MISFDDWVASFGDSVSAGGRTFLRAVFDEQGPVSPDEAQRLGHAHQLACAREAVTLLGRDISATSGLEPPLFEYRDEGDAIRLCHRGQYATTPISGLTQAEVTVEVADFIQGEVMEDLHRPWPECREHGTGLHPTLSSDHAAWACRSGPHVIADIGQIPARCR